MKIQIDTLLGKSHIRMYIIYYIFIYIIFIIIDILILSFNNIYTYNRINTNICI